MFRMSYKKTISKFKIDESEMDFLIDSIRLVEGTNVALCLKSKKMEHIKEV
jgi:hypothetical protein